MHHIRNNKTNKIKLTQLNLKKIKIKIVDFIADWSLYFYKFIKLISYFKS